MENIVCFGEIMLRVSPWEKSKRIFQTNNFLIEPAGSESNVAINLANLGQKTTFLSAIPNNNLGKIILKYLNKYRVNTSFLIEKKNSRLGIFWNENGVDLRASYVIYDRKKSAFSITNYEDYEWAKIEKNMTWFHTSGITAALNKSTYTMLENTLSKIKQANIPISIDLNYRDKLWDWVSADKNIQIPELMKKICLNVTLLCGNEEDFQKCLGTDSNKELNNIVALYTDIASQVFEIMPNLKYLAVSLRKSISASINDWSGLLFTKKDDKLEVYKGNNYHLTNIVDRVGGGDSFCAGIIYGLINKKFDYQYIIDFATTFSALKHTIRGDIAEFSVIDVEKTMEMQCTGRILR